MARIHEILRTLVRHEVRFVVVGGMSAVLQGAPVNTLDLDIVHDRAPDNVEHLLSALREMDARSTAPRSRSTGGSAPTAAHLHRAGAPTPEDQVWCPRRAEHGGGIHRATVICSPIPTSSRSSGSARPRPPTRAPHRDQGEADATEGRRDVGDPPRDARRTEQEPLNTVRREPRFVARFDAPGVRPLKARGSRRSPRRRSRGPRGRCSSRRRGARPARGSDRGARGGASPGRASRARCAP